jgi:mRNA interferase MazF
MPDLEVRRGDIWWVEFDPVRGSEQGGTRPALVLQNDRGNRSSSVTIVAAITSRHRRAYPFQVEITPDESGLDRPSLVLLNQLRTVDKPRLLRWAGRLSPTRMLDVERAIKHSLGMVA